MRVLTIGFLAWMFGMTSVSAAEYWETKRGCLEQQILADNYEQGMRNTFAATHRALIANPMALDSDKATKLQDIEGRYLFASREYQAIVKSICNRLYP